jgi:hypothetical protein
LDWRSVLLVPLLAEQVRQLIAAAPAEAERVKTGVEGWARYWLGPNFPPSRWHSTAP